MHVPLPPAWEPVRGRYQESSDPVPAVHPSRDTAEHSWWDLGSSVPGGQVFLCGPRDS